MAWVPGEPARTIFALLLGVAVLGLGVAALAWVPSEPARTIFALLLGLAVLGVAALVAWSLTRRR
jgi:hypothetical protein